MQEYEGLAVPGYVRTTVYKMDTAPDEYYLAVVFEDRDSYRAKRREP